MYFSLRLLNVLPLFVFAASIDAAPVQNSAVTAPSVRYALAAPAARFTLRAQGVDRAAELAADTNRPRTQAPRYAVTRSIHARYVRGDAAGGEWRDLPDGMALWRIPVAADHALSLAFGFRHFFLPPGAQMVVRGETQTLGPYTDADNPKSHTFATPLIHGDHATIEVLAPKAMKAYIDLELDAVHAGYRDILSPESLRNPGLGSAACNVDTICPQGDAWQREINAVAVLAFGEEYCSGQLINNTRGDRTPLLATAAHCVATQWAASNLILYWKYESPVCRPPGSDESAQPVPTTSAIAQTGGAELLATHIDSDVSLLRLNSTPPAAANVYFNGWDLSDSSFDSAVVIHHPWADAKRISLTEGTIAPNDDPSTGQGTHHWRVPQYSLGTTQPGSSGSGLLDGNHHLRGVLSNGAASCDRTDGDDEYGRLNTAWRGGGTPATRLVDWLDPGATGATQIEGVAACALDNVSLDLNANPAVAGDKVALSATASGGVPPYSYAFDVDDDGQPDNTDPTQASISAIWPAAWSGNVRVKVTDSVGCVGTASKALIVQSPKIVLAATPTSTPQSLCGGTATAVEPGQRWRVPVTLTNSGDVASQAGYAVFAPNAAVLNQTHLTLETAAAAVPALAPGDSATINLDYAIDASNSCGAPVKIDLVGTTDGRSFASVATTVVDTAIATDCQAVTTCPAVTTPLQLDSGSYYDTRRGGNGMTVANIPQVDGSPTFFGLWFTGDAAREPTWYAVQAPLQGNQANAPIYLSHQTAPDAWPAQSSTVGSAQITLVDTDKFIYSWNLQGNSGGALFTAVTGLPSKVRLWYDPKQSGWGLYDQLVPTDGAGASLLFNLTYLYDASGAPRWVVGSHDGYADGVTIDMVAPRPTCPGCVWLDPNAGKQSAGSLSYTIGGNSRQISTNLVFPSAIGGDWTRSRLPLSPLYLSP